MPICHSRVPISGLFNTVAIGATNMYSSKQHQPDGCVVGRLVSGTVSWTVLSRFDRYDDTKYLNTESESLVKNF